MKEIEAKDELGKDTLVAKPYKICAADFYQHK